MLKLGLFGKILIAFWLTLVGLGLVLTLLLGSFSSEDRMSLRLEPSLLLLLERTLELEGAEAAERQRMMIKRSTRRRITITRETQGARLPARETPTLRQAVAPDGTRYVLRYEGDQPRQISEAPAFALWGVLVTGLLFSIALAVYLSRPIRLLRDGFDRLAGGDLEVRLARRFGRRNDEFADLASDFDVMAERLGQLVRARDRLLNDVSHELRSPLTRLQLAVGLARQDPARMEASLRRIEAEAHKLDVLVAELLALARAESGADFGVFFDPVGVISEVVTDAGLEARAKGCRIAWGEPDSAENERPVIAGSTELFRRAIENVIRNAIRFSPAGTSVEVTADVVAGPPRFRIAIRDRGPGVDSALVDKLSEPFVRADQGGTGLGLSIANRAIRAHHGTLTCRNREGGGFVVEITVPAQQSRD